MCRQFDSSQHHQKKAAENCGFFCGAMHPLIPQSLRDSPQGQGERIPPTPLRGSPFCRPSASGISPGPMSIGGRPNVPSTGPLDHFWPDFHAQRPTRWTVGPPCHQSHGCSSVWIAKTGIYRRKCNFDFILPKQILLSFFTIFDRTNWL